MTSVLLCSTQGVVLNTWRLLASLNKVFFPSPPFGLGMLTEWFPIPDSSIVTTCWILCISQHPISSCLVAAVMIIKKKKKKSKGQLANASEWQIYCTCLHIAAEREQSSGAVPCVGIRGRNAAKVIWAARWDGYKHRLFSLKVTVISGAAMDWCGGARGQRHRLMLR